jgi:hypothetical protein
MNIEPENPEALRRALRKWSVNEPLPPRFQEGVWRKIQEAESSALPAVSTTFWSLCRAWLNAALPRPAVATAYLLMLLFIGAGAGIWQARSQTSRLDDTLGARYVQSVDPYQQPRL